VSALGQVHTLDLSNISGISDVSALGQVYTLDLEGCSIKKPAVFEMTKEAIVAIKDCTGTSSLTIEGYICINYPSVLNSQQHLKKKLRDALKKAVTDVADGKLTKVKARYKLNKDAAKPKKAAL
jgi:hypothetical protein